MWHSVRSAG